MSAVWLFTRKTVQRLKHRIKKFLGLPYIRFELKDNPEFVRKINEYEKIMSEKSWQAYIQMDQKSFNEFQTKMNKNLIDYKHHVPYIAPTEDGLLQILNKLWEFLRKLSIKRQLKIFLKLPYVKFELRDDPEFMKNWDSHVKKMTKKFWNDYYQRMHEEAFNEMLKKMTKPLIPNTLPIKDSILDLVKKNMLLTKKSSIKSKRKKK